MQVLHAAFLDSSLALWLEPERGAEELLRAVSRVLQVRKAAAKPAVVWLPAHEGKPVPSSPLLGEIPADANCQLAPHAVTVLPLEGRQAIGVLAACAGQRIIAPGVLIGEDLAYWTDVLRFAGQLVIRGQFLPGVSKSGDGYVAQWRPVLPALETHALAKAMPPCARAAALAGAERAPDTPADVALTAFGAYIVDALVRVSGRPRGQAPESLHEQWLNALTAADPALTGPARELEAFASHIEEWQRPVQVAARAPFRLCFRLAEPKSGPVPEKAVPEQNAEPEPWTVEYLLQSTKDPSLLLPAGQVWEAKPKDLKALKEDAAILRQHLLVGLGQAGSLSPEIEASLQNRAPSGYQTDAAGAHGFLRDMAPVFEQSGFGVMLPKWWTRRGSTAKLRATAKVKTRTKSGAKSANAGLGMNEILTFDWELALGDQKISRAELQALAKQKASLVNFRGQWIEAGSAEIQAAMAFLRKNTGGQTTLREVIQMALGGELVQAGPLEVEGVSATGWLEGVLEQLAGREPLAELPPPEGLNATLRPYQIRGYSWLQFLKRTGLGACLADDMGLGKTIQTLALVQRDRRTGEQRPVLLVCPMSVVGNWQKETARFTPELAVMVHHGMGRHRGETFAGEAARHAMVVSSYTLLHRDREMFSQVQWAGIVLDEAQNIKNPETLQAKAARSLPAAYRIALTGTPVENNIAELWSIMEFLNPGFLGTRAGFHKKFFVPIQVYSDQNATKRLRRITGPFILRRLKSDRSIIADLPDKLEMKVFCNLTKEQASLYQTVVKNAEAAIESSEGIERKGLVLATLMKLKQVCNHPAQFLKDNSGIPGRSGKLARLGEMLEEAIEAGDRSLVFTQFFEMGGIVQRYLQETYGIEVPFLHGGTPKGQRDRMVERFAVPDGPRVFVLSLKAGGTGLNLTGANHVFHYDRWWNPAVENQATDRAYRIGQTRKVQVHKFVCAGTLEERIDEMIERKKAVAGSVVSAGEAGLSELSNDQLRDLFALRRDAVGE